MNILRNRFLGTAAALLAPADKPNDGKDTTLAENVGEDDTAAAAAGDEDAGENAAAAGDEDTGGADEDTAAAASDEDDDPDLADLPPEVKAKAKAAIAKRVAAETGWRDRQIDKLHARRRSAEEDARAMETIADPARRAAPAAGVADPTKKFTQAEVTAEAQRIAAQDKYDRDANDADAAGKKAYGDKWGKTLAQLPKLGGLDVTDMVDILNTDQPHVVLFNLSDPTEYERVMSLPPARRRNEFVKLSLKEAPKPRAADSKRPSDATAPVTPVTGGRRVAAQQVNLMDDKLDDDAWYKARNATRRKKFSDHV